MPVCIFFDHRFCPELKEEKLEQVIADLIEQKNADTFYVGCQGEFDEKVIRVLAAAENKYPHIRACIVLAGLPESCRHYRLETLLPEGLEQVPPRFAVDRRNRWMVEQADWVVSYAPYHWGGAAKFTQMAARKGKKLIVVT